MQNDIGKSNPGEVCVKKKTEIEYSTEWKISVATRFRLFIPYFVETLMLIQPFLPLMFEIFHTQMSVRLWIFHICQFHSQTVLMRSQHDNVRIKRTHSLGSLTWMWRNKANYLVQKVYIAIRMDNFD